VCAKKGRWEPIDFRREYPAARRDRLRQRRDCRLFALHPWRSGLPLGECLALDLQRRADPASISLSCSRGGGLCRLVSTCLGRGVPFRCAVGSSSAQWVSPGFAIETTPSGHVSTHPLKWEKRIRKAPGLPTGWFLRISSPFCQRLGVANWRRHRKGQEPAPFLLARLRHQTRAACGGENM